MKIPIALLLCSLPAVALTAVTPDGAMLRHATAALGTATLHRVWVSADRYVGVYNRDNGGFAITTADGLVGYSDSGSFSEAAAPPALLEILDNVRPVAGQRTSRAAFTPVAPLLGSIAWDQTDPYNLLCPVYYGSQRSATGCAATAMAQIMRYYCWPPKGEGSHSYEPEFYPSMGTVSVDFSLSVYDWEKMTPVYTSSSTVEERQAVARLMYDAGVAISMNYGPASGAMSQDWPAALVAHFGYDSGVALLYRAYYDLTEWENTISGELAAGRPVYVTGFTDAGGHAFVFDGIDASGMVHVNWGWSGMSNGYFDLLWLSPSTQGTGGSTGGFNSRQMIVTRIQPAVEGTEPAVSLISEEGLTATPRRGALDGTFTVRLNGKIENVGWRESTVDFGLLLADASGAPVREIAGTSGVTVTTSAAHRNLLFGDVEFGDLPDGEYRLYPVARASGGQRWERIRDKDLTFPNYLNATVAGGEITFAAPEMASLHASVPELDGALYAGMKGRATVTVTNSGETEYMGALALAIFDPATGRRLATGESFTGDIMPGESREMELFANFDLAPGEYLLGVVEKTNIAVSDKTEVTLLPAADPQVTAVTAPDFGDNDAVDPMDVHAVAEVASSEGSVFSGQLFLYIYEAGTSETRGCLGPVFVQTAGADDVKTVRFAGTLENVRPAEEFDACLVDGETFTYVTPRDVAATRIRIAGEAGIGEIHDDAATGTARYLSIQGVPLKDAPQYGPYIEIRGGKAFKVFRP